MDSQLGAKASANLYSIVMTCRANGIEPYAYLCHLFEEFPKAKIAEQRKPCCRGTRRPRSTWRPLRLTLNSTPNLNAPHCTYDVDLRDLYAGETVLVKKGDPVDRSHSSIAVLAALSKIHDHAV